MGNLSFQITNNKVSPNQVPNRNKVTLDSIGINGTESKLLQRKQRFRIRAKQQSILNEMRMPNEWAKALKTCGRGINKNHADRTKVTIKEGKATLPHTNTCGSFNCPYCSVVKGAVYGEKISDLVGKHLEEGGKISFLTLTCGFPFRTSVNDRIDFLHSNFYKIKKALCRKYGISLETIKRTEHTINKETNQPHFHLHTLLFHDNLTTIEEQFELIEEFIAKWAKGIRRAGYNFSLEAQKFIPIEDNKGIATYLSKSLSFEFTSSITKKGNYGLNHFDYIMYEGVSKEKKERVLRDIIEGTMKRRMLTFSRGLNADYRALEEKERQLKENSNDDGECTDLDNSQEEVEEIELPYACANGLLNVDTDKDYLFSRLGIHTEDILQEIVKNDKFREFFEDLCADCMLLKDNFYDDEDCKIHFLINLEEKVCLEGYTSIPLPYTCHPPSIH